MLLLRRAVVHDEVIIEEGTTGSIEIDAGGPGDSLYWEDAPSFGQYAYIDDAGALRFGASMSAEEGASSLWMLRSTIKWF